jgi:hypothetical protein
LEVITFTLDPSAAQKTMSVGSVPYPENIANQLQIRHCVPFHFDEHHLEHLINVRTFIYKISPDFGPPPVDKQSFPAKDKAALT